MQIFDTKRDLLTPFFGIGPSQFLNRNFDSRPIRKVFHAPLILSVSHLV